MVQVARILDLGYRPLVLAIIPEAPTPVGLRNLEAMKRLGADVVEVNFDPIARAELTRRGLIELGDVMWAENYTIYTVPVTFAVRMGIPLMIWGENPANEYGGPAAVADSPALSRAWFEEMGGLHGRGIEDFLGESFTERHAQLYRYPSDDELARVGVTGLFLGYYFPWDGVENYLHAQALGFEAHPTRVEGSILSFEHIDSYLVGIHDYFKFLKFGFGRVSDVVGNQIRRGRMTRREAAGYVSRFDGEFPWSYLGKPLAEILAPFGVSVEEFMAVCDRFTNPDVFRGDGSGGFAKDATGRPQLIDPVIPEPVRAGS